MIYRLIKKPWIYCDVKLQVISHSAFLGPHNGYELSTPHWQLTFFTLNLYIHIEGIFGNLNLKRTIILRKRNIKERWILKKTAPLYYKKLLLQRYYMHNCEVKHVRIKLFKLKLVRCQWNFYIYISQDLVATMHRFKGGEFYRQLGIFLLTWDMS